MNDDATADAGSREPPALDEAALQRLHRVGGDELVEAMIRMFIENGRQRTERARTALEAGDVVEAGRAAHALKSSAGNVGLRRLQMLADRLEREAAEGGGAEQLRPLGDRLVAAYEEGARLVADRLAAE